MSGSNNLPFRDTLPIVTVCQVRDLLDQVMQEAGAHAFSFTEATLGKANAATPPGIDWFSVMVSASFSLVFWGQYGKPSAEAAPAPPAQDASEGLAPAPRLREVCTVELTFEPEAIATFLQTLIDGVQTHLDSDLIKSLQAACSTLGPNDPTVQSQFTLRLIKVLTTPSGERSPTEIAYQRLFAQVQEQKDNLEQRVIDRTQELRDAMLAAQSASRSKSEFLASVSHELRTPLTAIIGMSATLLRWSLGDLSERQRSFLQTIHDSGQRLLELINDILDLSQVESGNVILKLSEFSLAGLVQQSLKAVDDTAKARGVALQLDLRIDSNFDRFVADPFRIRQVLLNLLNNAIKFTPSGGKVVLRVLGNKTAAIFQVIDTGIGIPEHQRPLLFQKFQQLDGSYHRAYEGTGLGLALTKQLVELHGGRIMVESTVGVGSIFTVQIPARPSNAIAKQADAPLEFNAEYPLGRILLIESHEESANILCDMLTAAGYQVVWMVDSSMALHQVEILQPIAVIADVYALASGDYELIRALRQNPATKQVKVVALTSANADEMAQYLDASVDDYLTKPIYPEQILPKVLMLTST